MKTNLPEHAVGFGLAVLTACGLYQCAQNTYNAEYYRQSFEADNRVKGVCHKKDDGSVKLYNYTEIRNNRPVLTLAFSRAAGNPYTTPVYSTRRQSPLGLSFVIFDHGGECYFGSFAWPGDKFHVYLRNKETFEAAFDPPQGPLPKLPDYDFEG